MLDLLPITVRFPLIFEKSLDVIFKLWLCIVLWPAILCRKEHIFFVQCMLGHKRSCGICRINTCVTLGKTVLIKLHDSCIGEHSLVNWIFTRFLWIYRFLDLCSRAVFADDPGSVPRPLDMATLLLGCANSMCNPIIYGVMNKRFRKGFHRLFCFFRNRAVRGLDKTDISLQMNSSSKWNQSFVFESAVWSKIHFALSIKK